MANFIENVGLGFLKEEGVCIAPIIEIIVKTGKPITGYYGMPYFNKHFGDIQLIAQRKKNEAGDALELFSFDIRCAGSCV